MPESSSGDRRILPPPPPELAEQRDAEADARRQAEEREAEQARKAEEREAAKARKAEERRTQRESAKSEKAEKEAAAQRRRERAAQERSERAVAEARKAEDDQRTEDAQQERESSGAGRAGAAGAAGTTVGAMVARGDEGSATRTTTMPKVDDDRGESAKQSQQPRQRPAAAPARRTRRAQLRLAQVDAWSVMKTSFLLSIAIGIVLVVAVGIVWAVLGAAGVWDSINSIVQQAVGSADGPQFDVRDYVGTSRVLGIAAIVAVVDVLLITAIATLGAFLYNLSAALLGGIEVTLAEDN